MSERLSDDDLELIEQRADEIDALGIRTAHPWMRRAVHELRERRAMDLSEEERELLAAYAHRRSQRPAFGVVERTTLMHGVTIEQECDHWREQTTKWREEYGKAFDKLSAIEAALNAANVSVIADDDGGFPRAASTIERIALLAKERDEARALCERSARELASVATERDEHARISALRGEEVAKWAHESGTAKGQRDKALDEVERLTALINTPRTDDFFEAVRIESAHQIERWGVEHDAGKRAEDWLALYFYLLGKAAKAHFDGNHEKLLHHIITVAAVALNWHRHMTGVSTAMRPGVGPRPMRCICGHTHAEHDMHDTTACRGDSDGRRCRCTQWSLDDMHLHATKDADQ